MVKIDSAEAFEQHLQKKYRTNTCLTVQKFEGISRQFTRIMIQDKVKAYFVFRIKFLKKSFDNLNWLEKYRITIGDELIKELTAMNTKLRYDKRRKSDHLYNIKRKIERHNKRYGTRLELVQK